ncbi:MAG: DMT family transporter [Christensenellaceae bacterium]|jgi:transporter family-2 protein|nr:DMT family transporter [Christensenellaceae bacterium]
MLGVLFSVIAGAAMSFQGVMNTRLGEKVGLYEANAFVQGTAFLLSLLALWVMGNGDLRALGQANKGYLLGGALGLLITVMVMLGLGQLRPVVAISVILISQLCVAALIDALGWLGTEPVPFHFTKFIGLALMIGGVLLFKLKS